ncbi:MAG: hypothetical protein M1480_06635 [Bacteroidetes bacterium]|nr:hypothetical protein [Bacteroidota bacterium]
MEKRFINPRFLVITGMILAGAIMRLLPHYPNFTPISAMALFGGAYFTNKKLAFIIPFAAMFLSDLFLGFHPTMLAVYLSFALIVMIGFSLRQRKKVLNVALAALSSSILFFVITNFAVWLTGEMYPLTVTGLAECYTAAIPFFQNNVLGDLIYTGIFFSVFELARLKFPVLANVNV